MTTKKPEEFTYSWKFCLTRIHEKIQIHFEINFISLPDSIKHFVFVYIQLKKLKLTNGICPNVVDMICFEQVVPQ